MAKAHLGPSGKTKGTGKIFYGPGGKNRKAGKGVSNVYQGPSGKSVNKTQG
jgi:hypothetical protein